MQFYCCADLACKQRLFELVLPFCGRQPACLSPLTPNADKVLYVIVCEFSDPPQPRHVQSRYNPLLLP